MPLSGYTFNVGPQLVPAISGIGDLAVEVEDLELNVTVEVQ